MATVPGPDDLDDYSRSSTLIAFDHPIPLLRGPIVAGPPKDVLASPFVLAFKDPQSWASAYKACQSQIIQQCEAGARIGCSISASSKCRPVWWKTLFGVSKRNLADREKCEEHEMAICVEASKTKCLKFAKDKCLPVFRDARIAVNDQNASLRDALKLISWASLPDKSVGFEFLRLEGSWVEFNCRLKMASCRGSDLLGTNINASIEDFLSGGNGVV